MRVPEVGPDEFDAVLSDGRTIHVRPIRPDDAQRLIEFHERLSPETIHMRFFTPHPHLSEREVQRFTEVDGRDRAALVATTGSDIVAVVRYDRYPDADEAEVAFVVDDAHQGRGMATLLLEHLAAIARRNGVARFVAETLAQNRRMLAVFRAAGFSATSSLDHEVVHVSFPIQPDEAFLEAMEARERHADAASLRPILRPSSIAVVGATPAAELIGHNLTSGGFKGAVVIADSHADLADGVDLAIVVVADAETAAAVRQCGRVGVGGVVVTSAGADGLSGIAHEYGMRLVGPRSLGVFRASGGVQMNAIAASVIVGAGRAGLFAHGGEAGVTAVRRAGELGLGLSTFVSAGDKADVSGNDLLLFWEEDDETDVILLYIESFGNPRKFARIAQRVSQSKPIVAVMRGENVPADVAEAVFGHTGVIRVATIDELVEVGLAPPSRRPTDADTDASIEDIEPYLRRLR